MGRRSNKPEVSLFAFQDIITATTGILVLFVLALALLVADPAAPNIEEVTQQSNNVLQAELVDAQAALEDIEKELEEARAIEIRDTITEEEYASRIRYIKETRSSLGRNNVELRAHQTRLKEVLENLEERQNTIPESVAVLQSEIKQAEEELSELLKQNDRDELERQAAELRRKLEEAEAANQEEKIKVIDYDFSDPLDKYIVLIELKAKTANLYDYQTKKTIGSFSSGTDTDQVNSVIAVLFGNDLQSGIRDSGRGLYVFFAVSPGGIGKFRLFTQDEAFTKVAQGFDLLPNERLSIGIN